MNFNNVTGLHIIADDDSISDNIKQSLICFEANTDKKADHSHNTSITVVIFNLFNYEWLVANYNDFFTNNDRVIFFGFDSSNMWISRQDKTHYSACIFCLRAWLKNNLRDSGSWFSIDKDNCPRGRLNSSFLFSSVKNVAINLILNEIQEFKGKIKNKDSIANAVKRFDINKLLLQHHVFIPFPGCKHCSNLPQDSAAIAQITFQPRIKNSPNDYREYNPRLKLDNLRNLFVDRWVGLIKHQFYSINTYLVPMFTSESPIIGAPDTEMGFGRTETLYKSRLISILESLERFSAHRPRGVVGLIRDSYSNLTKSAIDPQAFTLHADSQQLEPDFNFIPYSDNLVFNWKWGFSVKENKSKLVPEQLVYYWLIEENNNHLNRFAYETSNGTSLGGSIEEASLFALLEVIERDAYMTTWYGRFSPKRIDLSTVTDPRSLSIIKRSEQEGLKIYLFDIRIDIDIPVVWAMVIDPDDNAPIKSYCASSANFDPEEAIWGALVEIITSISIYQKTAMDWREAARKMYMDPFMVKVMHDHVVLYSLPETLERFDFLFQNEKYYSMSELYSEVFKMKRFLNLTDELKFVMDQALGVAEDLMLVDITFPALNEMNLKCVKVLALGLHTITFGHQHRRVSLARVNKAAKKLGYKEFSTLEELNQFPHNFP